MTLKMFNEGFCRYRPEPQIKGTVRILQPLYKGAGSRWYIDVELENAQQLTQTIYQELADQCPGSFVEGYMKLKIPMMKGQFTYLHKNQRKLDDFSVNDTLNVTIACAGMFNLKGVWKPSWKLKVLEA
jgi:hypothetical protein